MVKMLGENFSLPAFPPELGRQKFVGPNSKKFTFSFLPKQQKIHIFSPIFSIPPKFHPTKHSVIVHLIWLHMKRNKFNFQITPLLSQPSTVLNAWILFSFNEFKIKEGSNKSSNQLLNPFFIHLVLMFMYLLFIKFLCQYFVHFLCLRGECVSWHGRVKVGEATSSRYEDIKNTFDLVTITEQHSC